MPDESSMLLAIPRNCHYCGNGYYALHHVAEYAKQKGIWDTIVLEKEQANKGPIFDVLNQQDPGYFYGFGHGNLGIFTCDAEEAVFTVDNVDVLANRVIYLLSCLTANQLGPAIINNGALAYAGFNISWTWISDNVDGDPYEELYGKCFYESANELWVALIDGETFDDAVQRSIDKYNKWIDYWFYENAKDPRSQECIMWLAHDRDGLVAYEKGDVVPTGTILPIEINWPLVIGIGVVAGLLFLSFKKQH